tara:strand:+ start:9477 stop:9812 length:336 start_codon:yes stop_codon:yes gene_type:complete
MSLTELNKSELIELAKGKKLDYKGTKSELISRLQAVEPKPSMSVKKEKKLPVKKSKKIDMELSTKEFVNSHYKIIFDRDATISEIKHYLYHLDDMKTITREEMIAELKAQK